MKLNPIIPIWLMAIISVLMIIYIIIKVKKVSYILMIVLVFIINLRIMVHNGKTNEVENNLDVFFIIDKTISMVAEDYGNGEQRLDGVKKDCAQIINTLNGARFTVITFDNTAQLNSASTRDAVSAIETIEIIKPVARIYSEGTNLNTPLELTKAALKRSYNKDRNRIRVLFYISDGEITKDEKVKSYSSLKKYINDGAVLGYGTTKGGKMKMITYSTNEDGETVEKEEYVLYKGKKAVSKYDESNLKQIANDLDISYIHMTDSLNIESKLSNISSKMTNKMIATAKDSYDDIYFIFALPLLVLIVLEFKKTRGELI